LPQVAAQGHQHLQVSKAVHGGGTASAVARLDEKARIEELARMLGGVEIARETRANARQMLQQGAVGALKPLLPAVPVAGPVLAALLRAHVEHQAVFLDDVAVLVRDLLLQGLDLGAGELDHLPGLDIHHVVVVLAVVEFINRLAALEVVLQHQAGRLELRQHPVNRGQADLLAAVDQAAVDVSALMWRTPVVSSSSRMRVRGWVTFRPALRRSSDSMVPPRCKPDWPVLGIVSPGSLPVTMLPMRKAFVFLFAAVLLSGCNLAYRQPIFQGNLLDKQNVDQLKPGMTRTQVIALVGDPPVADPFHHSRWDYIASARRGHGKTVIKNLTLYFEGDALTRMEGEYFPEEDADLLTEMREFGFYNLPKEKDKDSAAR
jgi:outer membrane protein assembly factor BamE